MGFDIYNKDNQDTNYNFSKHSHLCENYYDKNNFYHNNCNFNENSKKNIKNKTKKRKKLGFSTKFLIISTILIVLTISFFTFYVNPQIVESNKAQIKSYTTNLINNSIRETLQNNDYDDLIEILRDSQNNITLLQVNAKNVNNLNNEIMSSIQNKLNEKDILNYSLPLGNFSGIPALAGVGPAVNLNIVPIGNVNTKFRSQISSLSINQSYHKIYINITTSICIILPLYTQSIEISSQVLVAENIIVGQIPSTYLNTDNLTNALNLIP